MKATPLAVWLAGIKDINQIYQVVKAEVDFINPNAIVIQAVFLYTLAI